MLEKKRLPKILKSDTKTRALMFRESLRISAVGVSLEQEKQRIREVIYQLNRLTLKSMVI